MKNIHSQESGRSMIEMLGVLAIIGVLSVGGIAGYSQAMNKFKVSKATDQIQTMVQNIRTLYAGQKTYSGLAASAAGNALLYSAGVFTDEICPDGASCSTAMNPYGGTISVASVNDENNKTNRAFAVLYAGLPPAACVSLASQNWGDSTSGLIAVTATSGTGYSIAAKAPDSGATTAVAKTEGDVPMSLAKATAGCGSSGSSSAIIIYYK